MKRAELMQEELASVKPDITLFRGEWNVLARQRETKPSVIKVLQERRGLSEIVSRVVSGRQVDPDHLWPTLSALDSPLLLPDIGTAADLIADAIENDTPLVSCSDSDSDGNTAQAVVYESLTKYFEVPKENVLAIAGHKLKSGYGLTEKVADDILKWRPDEEKLIITSDIGSSDEPRIKRLAAQGHKVIVTDHHEFPLGVDGKPCIPASAAAVVSPARPDSKYPDRMIAGCFVAFLVMTQVRQTLVNRGFLPKETPKLTPLLNLVALGTLVDCVSMAKSKNNRALVRAGLRQINQGIRPCWRVALREKKEAPVTSEDLSFLYGPCVNSYSRVNEPLGGAYFFLSSDEGVAQFWWDALKYTNEQRKKIEKEMGIEAFVQAREQESFGRQGLVIYLPEGHQGIVGINSSRVVEKHGKPAVCFSPQYGDASMLTGSFRTVDGFHVKQGFDAIHKARPDVLPAGAYGGHKGAGGARIKKGHLDVFRDLFDAEVRRQTGGRSLYPVLEYDGDIAPEAITSQLLHELDSLEPYGREFPAAVFSSTLVLLTTRRIGKQKEHLSLEFSAGKRRIKAVWFYVDPSLKLTPGKQYRVWHTPKWNYWSGRKTVQLMIKGIQVD